MSFPGADIESAGDLVLVPLRDDSRAGVFDAEESEISNLWLYHLTKLSSIHGVEVKAKLRRLYRAPRHHSYRLCEVRPLHHGALLGTVYRQLVCLLKVQADIFVKCCCILKSDCIVGETSAGELEASSSTSQWSFEWNCRSSSALGNQKDNLPQSLTLTTYWSEKSKYA